MNKFIRNNRGFTLIELMITAAILVIVLAVAVPSFESVIQNNRAVALANDFVASLHLARSEAIKRGVSVSICASADQNFNACGNDWTQGWIIFVNPDGNTTIAGGTQEPIIRVHQMTGNGASVNPNPNVGIATYNSNGFAAAGTGNVVFGLSATGCTADHGRNVTISVTGRTSVTRFNC